MPLDVLAVSYKYRVGVLSPDEWATREELRCYPFVPEALPDPTQNVLIVVEDLASGAIVGSWWALNQIHLEGLYVTPEAREHTTGIQRLLLGAMIGFLTTIGATQALTLAADPAILALARKGGFVPIPGTLLQLRLFPESGGE